MNRQQTTLPPVVPSHKDASCLSVVGAMTIKQSCRRGLSKLNILDSHRLDTGMRLAQPGSSSQTSSKPWSQKTHIPEPGKTARTKCQLQPCKSQPKMSLEHNKESAALGTCRAAGTISVFIRGRHWALLVVSPNNFKREKNTSHRHNDVNLQESSHEVLSSLISTFCIFADSELIHSTTKPISMSSYWKGKYFVIRWLISKEHTRKVNIIY